MPGQIYFKITLLSQLQLSHIIMGTKVTELLSVRIMEVSIL